MATRNISFYLVKMVRISGWFLLVLALTYIASGYALCGEYGFDKLLSPRLAQWLHENLDVPFVVFLLMHSLAAIYLALRRWTWARRRKRA